MLTVSDAIDTMALLSVGRDNVGDYEKVIFLRYLDLANKELFQKTATINSDIVIRSNQKTLHDNFAISGQKSLLFLKRRDGSSSAPFRILSIKDYAKQKTYKEITLSSALEISPFLDSGFLKSCFYTNFGSIYFFDDSIPANTELNCCWIPQPTTLSLDMEMTTDDSYSLEIPYPPAYQNILIDGALYYLFQDEDGFRSSQKMAAAQNRWEVGKSRLIAYLMNKNNSGYDRVSTFSSI